LGKDSHSLDNPMSRSGAGWSVYPYPFVLKFS
jgi:hypothetical protein